MNTILRFILYLAAMAILSGLASCSRSFAIPNGTVTMSNKTFRECKINPAFRERINSIITKSENLSVANSKDSLYTGFDLSFDVKK